MKRSSFITIAAVAALLLTGCSAKNSSSECCSDSSQTDTAASTQEAETTASENNELTPQTLSYGEAEYTSADFSDYSTQDFSFSINNDFKLNDSGAEQSESSKSYTFDNPKAQLVIHSFDAYAEPKTLEDVFYSISSSSPDVTNIYTEHDESDGIYSFLITSVTDYDAATVAVAIKNGYAFEVEAPSYPVDNIQTVVPMIKDIIESAELISDKEPPSGIGNIDNDIMTLEVPDNMVVTDEMSIGFESADYNNTSRYNVLYKCAENKEQYQSSINITIFEKNEGDTAEKIITEMNATYNQSLNTADTVQNHSEFKGIPAEELSMTLPDHSNSALRYIVFEKDKYIVQINTLVSENSSEIKDDFNNLIDSIKLK
ncbi:MAG: hypothetical protein II729_06970 [Ruminococcus sp.]|nr:hypothetical protein [Ruminococcus sp.]